MLHQVFIQDLVRNLFGEGNDVFKEGEWTKSIEMHTEALSIAEYADSEDITVSGGILESLYANRAAAYLNIVSKVNTIIVIGLNSELHVDSLNDTWGSFLRGSMTKHMRTVRKPFN